MNQALQDLSDTVVLIPAAGRVAEGVLALANIACPAMVPVAGRPVIHWTMRYLRSLGLRRFVIAVAARGMFIEDFVECSAGRDCEVTFLTPTADGGVGRTVAELAERATGKSALVVLGDTHFQFADASVLTREQPVVLTHPVDESYRWCVANTDADGRVRALHDKQRDLTPPLEALVGVYFFPDLEVLRAAAKAAVAATPANARTEMSSILTHLQTQGSLYAVRAGDWLDVGNPDRQASSHRSLLQKRDFNELSIDPVLGAITKRSRQVEKFINEINYLRLLPAELALLFPRVVDFSTAWENPWLKMEYYGYPSLAEVFVFENVDPGIWERVFVHLRQVLTEGFMRYRRPLSADDVREMYLGKTRRRLAEMQAPDALRQLARHAGTVELNGRRLDNLPLLWDRLDAAVERLATNATGSIIHGDLCLSNILYDLRSGVCKLLDPRGSFGAAGIYGDPRYDVAKLYHSVYGLYDFITNDLFHASIDGNAITLDIRQRRHHDEVCRRFERVFFPTFDRREILLLTGLLFASMPALHYDAPERQTAMYARALELLNDALDENNMPSDTASLST